MNCRIDKVVKKCYCYDSGSKKPIDPGNIPYCRKYNCENVEEKICDSLPVEPLLPVYPIFPPDHGEKPNIPSLPIYQPYPKPSPINPTPNPNPSPIPLNPKPTGTDKLLLIVGGIFLVYLFLK